MWAQNKKTFTRAGDGLHRVKVLQDHGNENRDAAPGQLYAVLAPRGPAGRKPPATPLYWFN
jgi:hypothetical protein